MKLACLLTAAGSARRFGQDKLLISVAGRPMGVHALEILQAAPFDKRVIIVSGDKGYLIESAEKRGFDVVVNPEPEKGMSVSVALGTRHICRDGAYDGILYAVADQPALCTDTVKRLMKAFEAAPRCIWAPEAEGRRGNPVIFPALLFNDLMQVRGDRGGRQVIAEHPELLRTIPVDPKELKDIDKKEDLLSC